MGNSDCGFRNLTKGTRSLFYRQGFRVCEGKIIELILWLCDGESGAQDTIMNT
jgi:hypothetical protein